MKTKSKMKQLGEWRIVNVIMMVLMCTSLSAGTAEPFLGANDYADFTEMFVAPNYSDATFFYDLQCHAQALNLWDSQRACEARADSAWDIGAAKRFEQAFKHEISLDKTPELYQLLERTALDVSLALRGIKDRYHRIRPFVFFNEGTLIPSDEETLSQNGSYPSGHSAVGMAFALILAEIAPEKQNAILLRGLDYGYSRVVANYHWMSDVEAGRQIAAMVVSRLHACETFEVQLHRAKLEYDTMISAKN